MRPGCVRPRFLRPGCESLLWEARVGYGRHAAALCLLSAPPVVTRPTTSPSHSPLSCLLCLLKIRSQTPAFLASLSAEVSHVTPFLIMICILVTSEKSFLLQRVWIAKSWSLTYIQVHSQHSRRERWVFDGTLAVSLRLENMPQDLVLVFFECSFRLYY